MTDLRKLAYTDAREWYIKTQPYIVSANWRGLLETVPPNTKIRESAIWNNPECLFFRVRLSIQKIDERLSEVKRPTNKDKEALEYYEEFMRNVILRGKKLEPEKSQRWLSALAYFYYNRWIGNAHIYSNYDKAREIYDHLLRCDHTLLVDKYRSNKLNGEFCLRQLHLPAKNRRLGYMVCRNELTTNVLHNYQLLVNEYRTQTEAVQNECKSIYVGALYNYAEIVIKQIFIRDVECVLTDYPPIDRITDPSSVEKFRNAYRYIKEVLQITPQEITKANLEGEKPHIIDIQYRYAQALLICAVIARYQGVKTGIVKEYLAKASKQFERCICSAAQAKRSRIRINEPYYIYSSWAVTLFLLNKPQEAYSKLSYVIEQPMYYLKNYKHQCQRVFDYASNSRRFALYKPQ